ncbi:MAG: hypothetical protein LBG59_00965 [Candidatus Peribacteria bacterium]|jgi:hypothetical protein|nr:hypothetical protein [Candidatus Peribacteria bacterium]
MSVSIGIVCLFSRFFGVSPVWSAGIDMGIGLGISDFLKQSLATREQKSYLNQVYASNFSMDPFKVAMNNAQGQGNELLLGGIQSIVLQLQKKSCSLAQTDIALILAYAHKPFKSTTTYQIFSGTVLESTTIETEEARKACDRFNQCYYAPDAFKGDMMTDCQTKFVSRYTGGYSQTERIQGVQMAQAGSDKYWNSSLKDSPYDLMYDMSAVSKVLFENIQEPVEVVFYHLPEFSNQGNAGGGSSPSGSRPSSRSSTRSTTASTTSSLGTGVVLP